MRLRLASWIPFALGLALLGSLLLSKGEAGTRNHTGSLRGQVLDEQGTELPGVTLTVAGNGAPQVSLTNLGGRFRFVFLSPGSYHLKAELEGFSTTEHPNIVINIGRHTTIEMTLSSAVEDVITVSAESPLLDETRIVAGATVARTELETVPTARDPWAILASTPGVLTERINVGGSESGQGAQYVGPGSRGDQAVWTVDGIVISDLGALGSSPAYFDFDAFEEMQVTIGGDDASEATAGIVLNMVTRRGTNEWRGAGRYIRADDDLQSDLDVDPSELGRDFDGGGPVTAQPLLATGNRILGIEDYGAELGGPIVQDRLWIWGSYGMQKRDLRTIPAAGSPHGVEDFTEAETANAKLNVQIVPSNSATVFALHSDKKQIGRNAGPTRPQETTWNMAMLGDTPTSYKVEDTQIFGSNFYLTGLYSVVNSGFELVPRGGTTLGPQGPTAYTDETAVWHHTFAVHQTERPQEQLKADASLFVDIGSVGHELKLGASDREAEIRSFSVWPGAGLIYAPAIFGSTENVLALSRPAFSAVTQESSGAYLQDTVSVGRLTANVGVRYDLQEAANEAVSVPANPLLPNLLPAIDYDGTDPTPKWESISPRLGLTYALGKERKTLLRASYSQFADQMATDVAAWLNPLRLQSYAYVSTSSSGPNVSAGDILSPVLFYSPNVDPRDGRLLQSYALDRNLEPPRTDELLFSVERAFLPELVVSLNVTYRHLTKLLEQELLVFDDADPYCTACLASVGRPHNRSDYVAGTVTTTLPDGQQATRTVYQLRPGVSTRLGTLLENGDREQEYWGASLSFNKRLANRWMLRGHFTLSDWTWSHVPVDEIEDPTQTFTGRIPRRGSREGDPVIQGPEDPDLEHGTYIHSKWSYNLNGMYQIAPDRPWGFNIAFNLNGRQGYPIPYFSRVTLPDNMQLERAWVQATEEPDAFRLADLHTVDLRLEKEFRLSDFDLTFGMDVFNVTNEATVLRRQPRLDIGTSDHVLEVLSPRIFRLGARISFR